MEHCVKERRPSKQGTMACGMKEHSRTKGETSQTQHRGEGALTRFGGLAYLPSGVHRTGSQISDERRSDTHERHTRRHGKMVSKAYTTLIKVGLEMPATLEAGR